MTYSIRTLCAVVLTLAAALFSTVASAAIQFIAASTADSITDSLTIARPGPAVPGTLLVAQITFEKGSALAVTAPPGWQQVVRTNRLSDFGQTIYYRFTVAGEATSYRWDFSEAAKSAGSILRYDGANGAAPVATFSEGSGDSDALTAPGLTAEANSRLVAFFGLKKDTTLSPPVGMAMRASHTSVQDVRLLVTDEQVAIAGATGPRTANAGVSSKWVAQMIELRTGAAVSTANPATLIEATDAAAFSNGIDTGAVRVTLVDGSGSPVQNVAVSFQVSAGTASLATPTGTTNANGQVSSTLTSTVVGNVQVIAQFDSNGDGTSETAVVNGSPAQVVFSAPPGSTVDTGNAGTRIEATDAAALANGTDTGAVRVTLVNASGTPVAGVAVRFTTSGAATLAAASGVTDASGQYATTLTNTVVETTSVTAQFDINGDGTSETAVVNGSPAQVVFSAPPGSTVDTGNAGTRIEATDAAALANGTDTGAVRVTLVNASGTPVAGVAVRFTTSGAATLAAASGVTDASGQYATTLTNTVVETTSVTAQFDINGDGTSETAVVNGSPAQVVFSAPPGSTVDTGNAGTRIEATDAAALANGTDTGAVRVTLVNASGTPVAGVAVRFTTSGAATLAAASGVTDASGQYATTLTNTVVETTSVTAQFDINGDGTSETAVVNGSPAQVVFSAPPGSTVDTGNASTRIEPTDAAALANGTDTGAVRVTLVNASGTPVAGVAVRFTTSGAATLAAASGVTDASGQYATTLTNTVVETASVTAQFDINGDGTSETAVVNGSPAQVVFSPVSITPFDTGNNNTRIDATDAAALANGTDAGAVRVTLVNASNTPVAGIAVLFASTGSATFANATGVTDANGQFATTLTDTVVETVNVTVLVDVNGDGTPETAVVNGSPAQVVFSDDGAGAPVDALIEAVDNSALANGADTGVVRVTLVDAGGLPAAGVAVRFATTSAATISTPTGVTDVSGRFTSTITSIVAETANITAQFDADGNGSTESAVVVGSPAAIVFSAPPVDAAIRKRISRSLVLLDGSGDRVEYEITVTNAGSEPIFGAGVLDALPAAVSQVQWTCTNLTGGTCGGASGSGDIDETVDLTVGGAVRYLVTGLIASPTGAAIVNTAAVSAANDFAAGNNLDSVLYQRCGANFQTTPGVLDLMPHLCVFRDGFEN